MVLFTEEVQKAIRDGEYDLAMQISKDNYVSSALSPNFSNGLELCHQYTEILDHILNKIFLEQKTKTHIRGDFLFGVGGANGRKETTLNSDLDIFLFMKDIETNRNFLQEYTADFRNTLENTLGYKKEMIINSPQDIVDPSLFGQEKLTALLDFRRLAGSRNLEHSLRAHLRKASKKQELEFVLTKIPDMQRRHDKYPQEYDELDSFNIKEGKGGLRDFQTGVWIKAWENYDSSNSIYPTLDTRLIDSLGILLRTRAWIAAMHSKSGKDISDIKKDVLKYEDLTDLIKHFGEEELNSLIMARKRIHKYSAQAIHERLSRGINLPRGIIYTLGGLSFDQSVILADNQERFYRLLYESQVRNIALDPVIYHSLIAEASTTLKNSSAFLDLLAAPGSFAKTMEHLCEMDIFERIVPGFDKLETGRFEIGHRHEYITRGRRTKERLKNFENLEKIIDNEEIDKQTEFFRREYGYLDSTQKQVLRLALLCKDIPTILDISPERYFQMFSSSYPHLPRSSLENIAYIINNKRIILDISQENISEDKGGIEKLARSSNDSSLLRSLMLFTYADLGHMEKNHIGRDVWAEMINLYRHTQQFLDNGKLEVLRDVCEDEEGNAILKAIPDGFFGSKYAKEKQSIVSILKKVSKYQKPIVHYKPYDEELALIQVVAPDRPGMLWKIAGSFYKQQIPLKHAKIYSLAEPNNLALDLFDVERISEEKMQECRSEIEQLLSNAESDISINPSELLYELVNETIYTANLSSVQESDLLLFTLRMPRKKGIFYTTTRILGEETHADIRNMRRYLHSNGDLTYRFFFKTPLSIREVNNVLKKYLKYIKTNEIGN
ncbi:hypothetical protein J4461_02345 [Candidatus Pacearchaeota archaeon]|nr:hypothetical protein [Candidatus Pacearchaeota archaeon]